MARTVKDRLREITVPQELQAVRPIAPGPGFGGTTMAHTIAPLILPTGLSILEGLILSRGGKSMLGIGVGEAGGSAMGEQLNQTLGITKRDPNQVGMAAGFPPIARRIAQGMGRFMKFLPGASGEANVMSAEMAKLAPKLIKPSGNSSELFGLLQQLSDDAAKTGGSQVRIKLANFQQAAEQLKAQQGKIALAELKTPAVAKHADDIIQNLNANNNEMAIAELLATKSELGAQSGFGATSPTVIERANKALLRALEDDIESAATGSTSGSIEAALMKAAAQAVKLERNQDELAEIITKHIVPVAEAEFDQVNPVAMIRAFRKHPRLQKLPSQDKREIEDLLAMIKRITPRVEREQAKIEVLRPFAFGSLAAGYLDKFSPFDFGDAALATVPLFMFGPKLISKVLTSDVGRKMLRRALTQNNGMLESRTVSAIAVMMTASLAQPGVTITPRTQ